MKIKFLFVLILMSSSCLSISAQTQQSQQKTISAGVVNGKATNLPIAVYPPAAQAAKVGGEVKVQVTIDENGDVISAEVISGHQLLRATAVVAAKQAKFSPTLLNNQPVKVNGTIVYNFDPSKHINIDYLVWIAVGGSLGVDTVGEIIG